MFLYAKREKGGLALLPERRVEIPHPRREVSAMEVCDLILLVLKALPEIVKLAALLIRKKKEQTPPLVTKDKQR